MGVAEFGGIGGLSKLVPPQDSNVIATIHYYNPFNFTHQGAEWVGAQANEWLGTPWNDLDAERAAVQHADHLRESRRGLQRDRNGRGGAQRSLWPWHRSWCGSQAG